MPQFQSESDAYPSRLQHASAACGSNELNFRGLGEPFATGDEHALAFGFDYHDAIAGIAGAHAQNRPCGKITHVRAVRIAKLEGKTV